MIVACNNNIKEIQYSGFTIDAVYACGGQLVWEKEPTPPEPYCSQYLTFVPTENCIFKLLDNSGYRYSLDSGATWTSINGGDSVSVNVGEKIYWKRVVPSTGKTGSMLSPYSGTVGSYEIEGNIMSIVYGDNFIGQTSLNGRAYGLFEGLFLGASGMISAENLCLPATTLSSGCYRNMFYDCYNLVIPPKVLLADALISQCYENMFAHCESLTTAPDILATSFVSGTNASVSCCNQMFLYCTSLTKSPRIRIREDITASQANSQFNGMFEECHSLNEIYCLISGNIGTSHTYNFSKNVASRGVFYKNQNSTWTSGNDGIPNNWTVVNE